MSDGGALDFEERVRLVELVNRVLDKGVILRGEVTIGVAGIDLLYLELRLLLTGAEAMEERRRSAIAGREVGGEIEGPGPGDPS